MTRLGQVYPILYGAETTKSWARTLCSAETNVQTCILEDEGEDELIEIEVEATCNK